jgi:hypothetical protein
MANPPYCPLHGALRGDRWGSWGFPRVDGYEATSLYPLYPGLLCHACPIWPQTGATTTATRHRRACALGRARAKRTCCRAAAGTACSCHLGGRRSACSLMWAWTSGSARRRPAPHAAGKSLTRSTRHDVRRGKGQTAKPPPVHWGTTHPALKTRRGKTHGPRGPRPRGRPQDAQSRVDASPAAPA